MAKLGLKISGYLLLIAALGYQLFVTLRYSSEIPYGDEWHAFDKTLFTRELPLEAIFTLTNNHFFTWSKAQAWFFFKLNGYSLPSQQILSFVLFVGVVAIVGFLFAPLVGKSRSTFENFSLCLSLAVVFNLLNFDNLNAGHQTCSRLFLIFSLLAVFFLLDPVSTKVKTLLGLLCLVGGSFSIGMAMGANVAIVGSMLLIVFVDWWNKELNRAIFLRALLALITLSGLIGLWWLLQPESGGAGGLVLPHKLVFWDFFFNLTSLAFGYQIYSWVLGALCFILIFVPLVLFCIQELRSRRRDFRIPVAIVALLFGMLAITTGRAEMEPIEIWSKGYRYAEAGLFLIPLGVICILSLEIKTKICNLSLAVLLFTACLGYANDWGLELHRYKYESRKQGLECIRSFYDKLNTLDDSEIDRYRCPAIYSIASIGRRLEVAKEANTAIYKYAMKENSS